MFRLLLVATLVSFVACAPKSENVFHKTEGPSIINGFEMTAKNSLTMSIVALYDTKNKFICTGSLITPNVVLTAAHCAPKKISDLKVIFASDVDEMLNTREPDIKQEYVLNATDFKVSDKWDPNNEAVEIDLGDIALVKFRGSLPAGYAPATFLRDQSALKRGAIVTVAGFGVNLVESTPIDPKKYRNLDQAIEDGDVICDDRNQNCVEVEMSGDGLLRQTQAPISSLQETEIRLDERKAGTCSGDSGGPAYLELDGEYYLFGVTSRGSLLCDNTGVYTNALEYKDWIVKTIPLLK